MNFLKVKKMILNHSDSLQIGKKVVQNTTSKLKIFNYAGKR